MLWSVSILVLVSGPGLGFARGTSRGLDTGEGLVMRVKVRVRVAISPG